LCVASVVYISGETAERRSVVVLQCGHVGNRAAVIQSSAQAERHVHTRSGTLWIARALFGLLLEEIGEQDWLVALRTVTAESYRSAEQLTR
jgi:hypothetical protein